MKKNISADITHALKVITDSLASKNINWVIITSGALALQGVDIDPEDLDIMTDESGLLTINQALANYQIPLPDNNPSPIFTSTMSKFCINNLCVEVMSNFKIKSPTDNNWHDMHRLLDNRTFIDIEGMSVPVLPLVHLVELYTLMGRDKDTIKIEKIKNSLQAMDIAAQT